MGVNMPQAGEVQEVKDKDPQPLVEHQRQNLGERLDAAVLSGSRARGEATEESDWDLLIIAEDLPRSPLARHRLRSGGPGTRLSCARRRSGMGGSCPFP